MNDNVISTMDDDQVLCPECGKDVCSVDRIERRWPHKSLMIPRVIWVMVLGLFLLVSTPWVASMLGHSSALISSVQQSEDYSVRVRGSLLSGAAVRDASDGDTESRRQVIELLTMVDDEIQPGGDRTKIRFDFVGPAGTLYTQEHWGFGGKWVARSNNTDVKDLRNPSEFDEGFTERYYNFWDWFSSAHLRGGGGQRESFDIVIGSILAMIASCLAATYLVRRAGRRFGLTVVDRRHCRVILFLGLMIGAVVIAMSHQTTNSFRSSRGMIGGSTDWISADELHEAVQDAEKAERIIDAIVQMQPNSDPDDWLLGRTLDRGYITRFKRWEFAFGPLLEVGTGSHLEFSTKHPDGTTTRIDVPDEYPDGFQMKLYDLAFCSVRWTNTKSILQGGVYPTQIMLGVVFFYWLWKIVDRMSRFVFWRFERRRIRRRVRRGQCIFCAYPLSDEGQKARSLVIRS